jgi:putative Holliday junction resolvase
VSRFLALDVGERRIGVAMADTVSGSIKGLTTIRRAHASRDGATLVTLAHEHDAHELVLGLPLNADGSEGAQAFDTRAWGEAIERLTRLPVRWRDERHTSANAELVAGRMARRSDGGPPSARTRSAHRARVDQLAAEAIAQAELDARRGAERGK